VNSDAAGFSGVLTPSARLRGYTPGSRSSQNYDLLQSKVLAFGRPRLESRQENRASELTHFISFLSELKKNGKMQTRTIFLKKILCEEREL